MIEDLFRYLRSKLFGTKFVVLIDFDGEQNIRALKFMGGRFFVYRWSFLEGLTEIKDNGTIDGPSYVKSWKPYIPFKSKRIFPKGLE